MKTAILVRHGKSSWEYNVSDRDRPLMERGIKDVNKVAKEFSSNSIHIDAAYSSPANRALHTAMIFLRTINFPFTKFELSNELYDFSGEDVYRFLKGLNNDQDTVIIFGHNEAFTHIANSLGNMYIDNVPTSGLVQLKFDTNDWSAVTKGITVQTLFPKQL
ncbi:MULTISPECIES: SixA phosphatase family protein [Arenibacter]|jgi:phosphohistidine phosphatase|uniref:SixA phosphatase family protein n=1 Tax=Arenibacter TaxID=178469 RepID=UPI0004DF8B38|nr:MULTISPECIES: histidine phosphatase family protein [Arenibacter]GBF21728.1 phosphoglyceromutase [Arenibacter sp. NBRC 103722]HCO82631.1 histidine phosphatase family protein [Arenibacter sp.]|tara:strand:- start:55968 stop:56450 length:483 start_codon:yes stop_codon:yes gene_type:complete